MIRAFVFLPLLTVSLAAQPAPPACQVTSTPALLRAEGITERVGDIVIQCIGGRPTPAGQPIPAINLQVFFSHTVTTRLLDPVSKATEPLLIIDDPVAPQQKPCPVGPACPLTGTGGSPNPYLTSTGKNVWQGRLNGANSVIFTAIPFDPPGSSGPRTIRITDVRVNATVAPPQVTGLISVQTPAGGIVLNNPSAKVGDIQPGAQFSFRNSTNSSPLAAPVSAKFCQGYNAPLASGTPLMPDGITFHARFQESIPGGFKHRGVTSWPHANAPGTPALQVTYLPPVTEFSHYNPAFPPLSQMNRAGWVDFGTRVFVELSGLPPAMKAWTTLFGAMMGPPNSKLRRITPPEQNPVTAPMPPQYPLLGGITPMLPNGPGKLLAVFEVTSFVGLPLDTIDIPVVLAFSPSSVPAGLTITATSGYGPRSTVLTSTAGDPIPRFVAKPSPAPVFQTTKCP